LGLEQLADARGYSERLAVVQKSAIKFVNHT
jgi:hypothetical protein